MSSSDRLIHPVNAVGTDLLFAAGTKSVGTLVHGANRNVSWRITGLLAAGSLPASLLMIVFLQRLGSPNAVTAKIISVTLGVALLLTAILAVFRPQITALPPASAVHRIRVAPRC